MHARFGPARPDEGLQPQILKSPRKCDPRACRQGCYLEKSKLRDEKWIFHRISLEVRDFFVPLPSLNKAERLAPGAVRDARVMTQGIFYAHTSETCQRSHYTNSGGHPVRYKVHGLKSALFSDREGCRFLCRIGEMLTLVRSKSRLNSR